MASTTNFGWQTPDDTDLVKDGAAAIRTLGSAIDTSLVDLKGGTTGQVLSKNTNSDMDFTWVTTNDADAIQNSIVDAKGDLIAASANDTPARLAVGNDGETLVADSSATTGLRWTAGNVQGNPVLNSSFQVWQRGTSFAVGALAYTADRWQAFRSGGNSTFSRQVTGDTTNLPFIQYVMRMQRDSGNASGNALYLYQTFESINSIPFAGKTITVSFYARKGADFSATNPVIKVFSGTGTDQNIYSTFTGSVGVVDSTFSPTTSLARYTFTGSVPSNSTQLALGIEFTPTGTAGAADYLDITGFQIDVGSVALPFRTYSATLAGELAAASRYYYRVDAANAGDTRMNTVTVIANSTTVAYGAYTFPVRMRTSPTFGASAANTWNLGRINAALTAIAQERSSVYGSMVKATVASGLTAGNGDWLEAGNNNTAYIEFSAEL